jgi:GMP synthase (glutamine-hydrolysing)
VKPLDIHREKVLILDFGSQYTQLIARRIRELKVYCEIVPFFISPDEIKELHPSGLILSGGPASVYNPEAPSCRKEVFALDIPVLKSSPFILKRIRPGSADN